MASYNRGDARTDQQRFIEEKRRRVQEKLAAAQTKLAAQSGDTSSTVPLTPSLPVPRTSTLVGKRPGVSLQGGTNSKVIKTEAGSTTAPQSVPNFSLLTNDGNFLERFKKMQELQTKGPSVKKEPQSPGSSSSGQGCSNSTRSTDEYDPEMPTDDNASDKPKAELHRQLGLGNSNKQGISFALSQNTKAKQAAAAPAMTVASAFSSDDQDTPVSPPEDEATLSVIDKLARDVLAGGEQVEVTTQVTQFKNPLYWFLKDHDSDTYKYYRWRITKLGERTKDEGNDADTEGDESNSDGSKSKVLRKKKSRWGNETAELSPVVAHIPTPTLSPTVSVPGIATHIKLGQGANIKSALPSASVPTVQDFARRMVGSDTITPEQLKQIREQKEMNMMYELIIAQKKAKEAQAMTEIQGLKVKPKYEYDSDEDTEGGTWEHKKRTMEMNATKEFAEKLTEGGRGKHFIGDFLPPEELDRFMETFKALKEGREPDYSEYKDFKLTCENIGYQMMLKLGWKEGEGLGSEGKGITEPVNKGNVSRENRGLGVERPAELSTQDDEYDAFRKRMMLAYRFRPNPLNNPRRPYY
ncbi:SURP and G-patch domain-containing protein 1-like [Littorina saxatilis]|uniref:SURP and G-patch domain-containing protein 1-like protein n=1 Tax=Littorina saxatilis TaxID=31220 RepID=A0AAN9C2G6_9CAEN